eukprot:CCRYP_005063-RA/>CCRYP_005063-RA protein AED:0.33 eAED:0.32 QI:0/-1/0/1/-1/1/1/0/409
MTNRPNSRFANRSSFQGLSVIEGNRKASSVADVDKSKLVPVLESKERSERRRRTSSLAQSHQIREIITKTVEELSRKGSIEAINPDVQSAEDILNSLLTEAKESGYSSNRIFGLLTSSSINDGDEISNVRIPKETFTAGLRKLSKGNRTWRKEDLDAIAEKFDIDNDGFISMYEFQRYCYHEVPSVAWKAERHRMQNNARKSEDNDESVSVKDLQYSSGPECHRTSKLFWKINLLADIVLRYCEELDVISLQIFSISAKEDYKTLYVNKRSCAIDQVALKEAITIATQTADDSTPEDIKWGFYASYLVARLHMTKDENDSTGYSPSLLKLHGDNDRSIEIDKPPNMIAPEKRYPQTSARGKSIEDEFQSKVRLFEKESRSARTSRQTAEGLENIMAMALGELKLELGAI